MHSNPYHFHKSALAAVRPAGSGGGYTAGGGYTFDLDTSVEWLLEPGGVTEGMINDDLETPPPSLSNARERNTVRHQASLNWVIEVAEMTTRPSQDQLVAVISAVRQHIKREEYSLLSHVLSSLVSRPDLSAEAVIALLRSSYAGRKKIPGWKKLVSTARTSLEQRHLPSTDLLMGL